MADASAVFVGDGSLLIQCAQAWRRRGNEIRAVFAHDRGILDWARSEGIAAREIDEASPLDPPGEPFDYLFSVANLRVLPPSLPRSKRLLPPHPSPPSQRSKLPLIRTFRPAPKWSRPPCAKH